MSEFIYVPSKEIRLQINILNRSVSIKGSQIILAQKQIAVNRTLMDQYKEQGDVLKRKIELAEKSGNKTLVKQLELEFQGLNTKIQQAELVIENSNKRIPDLEKEIEQLNGELSDLNKTLEESLKYEEALAIRKTKTVVGLTNVSVFFGGSSRGRLGAEAPQIGIIDSGSIQLTISKGQKLNTLISSETGEVFIKVSTISNFENVDFIFKPVDYNNILISNDPHGGIIGPKTPNVIGTPENDLVFTLDNSYGFSNGIETTYVSQVLEYDMTLSVFPSFGFITLDVDRKDGDLSLWVMTSSGNA